MNQVIDSLDAEGDDEFDDIVDDGDKEEEEDEKEDVDDGFGAVCRISAEGGVKIRGSEEGGSGRGLAGLTKDEGIGVGSVAEGSGGASAGRGFRSASEGSGDGEVDKVDEDEVEVEVEVEDKAMLRTKCEGRESCCWPYILSLGWRSAKLTGDGCWTDEAEEEAEEEEEGS